MKRQIVTTMYNNINYIDDENDDDDDDGDDQ